MLPAVLFFVISLFKPFTIINAQVTPPPRPAVVAGTVRDASFHYPPPGLTVNITCYFNNTTVSASTATTGLWGYFEYYFTEATCGNGATVISSTTYNSQTGSAMGTMSPQGNAFLAQTHIILGVNVPTPTQVTPTQPPVVPEFGLVTGIMAIIGSGISYILLRKKA